MMEYNFSSLTEGGGPTIPPVLNVTRCLFLIVVTPGGKTSGKLALRLNRIFTQVTLRLIICSTLKKVQR